MAHKATRVLVLGAHPDDAEFHAGGLLWFHSHAGSTIRLISVTDGRSGHHTDDQESLVWTRRSEAAAAGRVLGCEYLTWDFHDGYLTPSLEVRDRIIREIRSFRPDLVLTHRPNDYHPDHRAVGQAVQDASYLVTVPKIAADVEALRFDPIVAYMPDPFTRPSPMRGDAVLDASPAIETVVNLLNCHVSQVYEWLPYNSGILDQVPTDVVARKRWLRDWLICKLKWRIERFWQSDWSVSSPSMLPSLVEAFEISEYAGNLQEADFKRIFPGCRRLFTCIDH